MLTKKMKRSKNEKLNFIIVFCFCLIQLNSVAQNFKAKKCKVEKKDAFGTFYLLEKTLMFREVSTSLEDYDLHKGENSDLNNFSSYFILKSDTIFLKSLFENIYYDFNWIIDKTYFFDRKSESIILGLTFISGSSSNPDKYYFLIDLKNQKFYKIDILPI
jgi:hypothetical protein